MLNNNFHKSNLLFDIEELRMPYKYILFLLSIMNI